MTIIVKFSDTTNDETEYQLVTNPGETEIIKQSYLDKSGHLNSNAHNLLEFIYPDHTERFILYSMNYRRH